MCVQALQQTQPVQRMDAEHLTCTHLHLLGDVEARVLPQLLLQPPRQLGVRAVDLALVVQHGQDALRPALNQVEAVLVGGGMRGACVDVMDERNMKVEGVVYINGGLIYMQTGSGSHRVVWERNEAPLDRLPLVLGLLHLEHEAVELLLQRLCFVVG